jgi:hypothetical protein
MHAGKQYYGTQFFGGKFTPIFSTSLTWSSDIGPMVGRVTGVPLYPLRQSQGSSYHLKLEPINMINTHLAPDLKI